MKAATIILFVMCLSGAVALAQGNGPSREQSRYDSLLARKTGADEFGMKEYVLALLKTGPVKIQDSTQRAELQRKHLQNIMRLAANGSLVLAGPFLDDQSLRGIFIFNVRTVEEAQALAETDPAVQAGLFVLEFHPWYGSAALMEVTRIHKTIEKKSVAD